MVPPRFNKALFLLVAAYAVIGWVMAVYYGGADRYSVLLYSRPVLTTTLLIAALFFAGVILKIMIVDRPMRLTRVIVAEMKGTWFTRERIGRGLPVVIAFLFFMAVFTSLKSLIPMISAYAWDGYFIQLDRTLHGGVDPWRLLQPVLGYPFVTSAINILYNMWFPVMFGVLYWQAFSLKRDGLRERYFLAFFLCWIVNGTILAMAFSSVGPCFYGRLFPGMTDFSPLMDYLRSAHDHYPVWALATQDMLWSVYQDGGLSYGSGIAAMPSLHVSIAFLQMVMGYKISRRLGHAFAAFFVVILLGSVHLGWHYAVDGYLAIIVTAVIWWMAGRVYHRA